MKDSLTVALWQGESSGRVLMPTYYSLKRLRAEEDLRHSKRCFCVSFGFLLRIIIGGVKLKEIH